MSTVSRILTNNFPYSLRVLVNIREGRIVRRTPGLYDESAVQASSEVMSKDANENVQDLNENAQGPDENAQDPNEKVQIVTVSIRERLPGDTPLSMCSLRALDVFPANTGVTLKM